MASTNINMLNKTSNNIYSDECYTPEIAIKPILPYLNNKLIYYDCTSGISSSIVDCLNNNNLNFDEELMVNNKKRGRKCQQN